MAWRLILDIDDDDGRGGNVERQCWSFLFCFIDEPLTMEPNSSFLLMINDDGGGSGSHVHVYNPRCPVFNFLRFSRQRNTSSARLVFLVLTRNDHKPKKRDQLFLWMYVPAEDRYDADMRFRLFVLIVLHASFRKSYVPSTSYVRVQAMI